MSEIRRYPLQGRKRPIELNQDEQAQLNTIIDLLIPADENFPPPSSLHVIDEFLYQYFPEREHTANLKFNEQRLRGLLHNLNSAADGNFCMAGTEKQQALLKHLEHHDPAFFQELWMLANHSYYTLMATRLKPVPAFVRAHQTTSAPM